MGLPRELQHPEIVQLPQTVQTDDFKSKMTMKSNENFNIQMSKIICTHVVQYCNMYIKWSLRKFFARNMSFYEKSSLDTRNNYHELKLAVKLVSTHCSS